ncbi:MAG: protein kinase [Myxococcales bacterium]|nr:protein kinase [Myxococcales bacterium]
MGENIIDGKYQLLQQLGRGGMGVVHEAKNLRTGRHVALKLISSESMSRDKESLVRFQREARAGGTLSSEHVAQVLDTGVDPKTENPYLVMELLRGETLQELIGRLGPLPPSLVLGIIVQSCSGLQRAHEAGVIHRDVKSANLFVARRENEGRIVKLLDFGIAKLRADQLSASDNHGLTRTGALLGSPLYMSPEQARGDKTLDGRSDIFSLGIVMYEALCGVTPFGHCDTLGALILAVCSEKPRPVQDRAPWVSDASAAIVDRALAVERDERFQSAEAMATAIRALVADTSITEDSLTGVSPEMRTAAANREPTAAPSSRAKRALTITPTRPRPRWLLPLGAMTLVGGGVLATALRAGSSSPAASPPVNSGGVAAPAPTTEAAATASVPTDSRVVLVGVTGPADVSVDVDGALANVADGKVAIRGSIGSVHTIRLTAGGRDTSAEIVIADTGPVPARVELGPPRNTASLPPRRASAGTTSARAAAPTEPPTAEPSGAPTIKRNF